MAKKVKDKSKSKSKQVIGGSESKSEKGDKKSKSKKDKKGGDVSKKSSKKTLKNMTPEEINEHRRRFSTSTTVAPPPPPKLVPSEPTEWNSDEVISHKLDTDGFIYRALLAMDESSDLPSTGSYHGLRRTFMGISANEIASKVKKFLSAFHPPEEKDDCNDDDRWKWWERMDLWAEAIKHILIEKKSKATLQAAENSKKELELTAADAAAKPEDVPPPPVLETPKEEQVTTANEAKVEGVVEEAPSVSATSSKTSKASKKKSKKSKHKLDKEEDNKTDAEDNKSEKSSKKKKTKDKSKDKKKNKNKNDSSKNTSVMTIIDTPSTMQSDAESSLKLRSLKMRKRGELLAPDDEPVDATLLYVVLQGFNSPKQLLQELYKIGVLVDGIVLLTDQDVAQRIFSMDNIADTIPGTFQPKNMLPKYLKFLENQANCRLHGCRKCRLKTCRNCPEEPVPPLEPPIKEKLDPGYRWFAYILNRANTKRPSFIPGPRADYIRRVKVKSGPPPPSTAEPLVENVEELEKKKAEEMEALLASQTTLGAGKSGKKKGKGNKSEKSLKQAEDKNVKLDKKQSKKDKINAENSPSQKLDKNKKLGKDKSKNKDVGKQQSPTDSAQPPTSEENENEEEEEGQGIIPASEQKTPPPDKVKLLDQKQVGRKK